MKDNHKKDDEEYKKLLGTKGKTKKQWEEMKNFKFNLYKRVEHSDADSLVFIPARQLLNKFHEVVEYWKNLSGEKNTPKNMFYIIYDKKADRPFSSEYNFPYNIFE